MKKVVAETLISQLAEQLQKMALAIRWSEKGCLLIAATEEPALEREMARALRERIDPEFKVLEFTFSAQPSEHLRLAYILTAISPPAPKSALFLFGLDDLAPEDRKTAIAALNGGRGFLSRAGYSVVLWLRPATIGDLMFKAPDFYSWRSGAYTFELPSDPTARSQTLAALGLHAAVNLDELRQRYLKYVIESYRWLDFRGLLQVRNIVRLPLEELFIPLSATIRANEPTITKGAASIEGEYFEAPTHPKDKKAISKTPLFRYVTLAVPVPEKRIGLLDTLKEHSHLVVLGEPGSGKSTLLKYLALTFAEGAKFSKERLQLKTSCLPVFIPISTYAEARHAQNSSLTFAEFIPRYFSDRSLPNLAPLLSTEIKDERLLFLFDGMDEVLTVEERREMAREIQALASRYPQCRVIVTSRIAGYDVAPLSGDFAHVTIAEFGPQEVEAYARKWSLAYERAGMTEGAAFSPEAQTRVDLRAENLVNAIKGNPSVERLAKNPLLLTILALIHHQGTRLPQRRVELYRLCLEALAETWNLARTPERPMELWLDERRLDERQVVRILAPVAFWVHEHKPAGLIERDELAKLIAQHFKEKEGKTSLEAKKLADDFIALMQQVAGLLVERGQDQFSFLHLTFQEYLAARYFAARKSRWELLRPHLHQARWLEVILLTAGVLFEDDATELVQQILKAKGEYDDLLHRNLLLAARCLADDVPVDFQLRRKIVEELIEMWRSAHFAKLYEEAANALVSLKGTASEALASDGLFAALSDADAEVRRRAVEALWKLGTTNEEVLTALMAAALSDENERVWLFATLALTNLGAGNVVIATALVTALQNQNLHKRRSATVALGSLGVTTENVVTALKAALRDEHESVRSSAAEALGKLGTASAELVAALHDKSPTVRSSAARALGELGETNAEVVMALVATLHDENENVRSSVALALGELGMASTEVVTALMAVLRSEKTNAWQSVALALGLLSRKSREVVSELRVALRNDDANMRLRVAQALGYLYAAKAEIVPELVAALRDENANVRSNAAQALGVLGMVNTKVVTDLVVALRDEDWRVRWSAAQALGELGETSAEVVMALVAVLRDEDGNVRLSAAEALGKLKVASAEVITALVATLHDTDVEVRAGAAVALGELGIVSEEIGNSLSSLLKDEEADARAAAAYALGKLAPPQKHLAKILRQMCKERRNEEDVFVNDDRPLASVKDITFEALWAIVQHLDEQQMEN